VGVNDVACYKYARPLLVVCDVERGFSQSKSVTIAVCCSSASLSVEGTGDLWVHLPNLSSRTMALGLTQPLIEMSTLNLREV
jgi:hypothetical protein